MGRTLGPGAVCGGQSWCPRPRAPARGQGSPWSGQRREGSVSVAAHCVPGDGARLHADTCCCMEAPQALSELERQTPAPRTCVRVYMTRDKAGPGRRLLRFGLPRSQVRAARAEPSTVPGKHSRWPGPGRPQGLSPARRVCQTTRCSVLQVELSAHGAPAVCSAWRVSAQPVHTGP